MKRGGVKFMKVNNGVIVAFLIILLLLIYQVYDLKKEVRSLSNNRVDIDFPSTLYLKGLSSNSTSGFGDGGFWIYNQDERNVYFFKYDTEIEQIVMTKKYINR